VSTTTQKAAGKAGTEGTPWLYAKQKEYKSEKLS